MDKRTWEQIEACRPGSRDIDAVESGDVAPQDDPRARAACERVQVWDAAILAGMGQVDVPAGLAERILGRLANSASTAEASSAAAAAIESNLSAATESLAPAATVKPPARKAGRREWFRAAAVSAVAASLLAAVFWGWLKPHDDGSLESLTEQWEQKLGERGGRAWQPNEKSPRGFAIPATVLPLPNGWGLSGWQSVDADTVAYRLSDENRNTAMLYVTRLPQSPVPKSPPARPQTTSGGKAIGYWQTGRLTYVLVVPGDERNYRMFVRGAGAPLA